MRNTTIRQKKGYCAHPSCSYFGPLTKGLCQTHYWNGIKLKSAAKFEEQEMKQNESLSSVVEDLDTVFSQWIRLKNSDENGYCTCYCGKRVYWTEADNSHYIPRAHMNTRYLEENCAPSCQHCNRTLSGNLLAYGTYIEKMRPGGVELLEEQARNEYNYSVSELKGLISFYSKEVSLMKKTKPMKI